MRAIEFIAEGEPAGKGSLRTFQSKNTGRHMGDWAPNVKRFQRAVERAAAAARDAADDDVWLDPIDGAVEVFLEFRFPVPQRRLAAARANGVLWSARRPDLDKLARTVLDGLQNAGIITQDARVAHLDCTKLECAPAVLAGSFHGVRVRLTELNGAP